VGEVLRKMFSLAVTWKMRTDNPATSFRKRPETARERFLSFEEIQRLADALCADPDQRAGIIRLCMLTGARCGEARTSTFDQFNVSVVSVPLNSRISERGACCQKVSQRIGRLAWRMVGMVLWVGARWLSLGVATDGGLWI
jgi:integrase